MDINQKLIRLLERIMGSRKGYCGDHYVYTPQLEADNINELHAELVTFQSDIASDTKNECKCGGPGITKCPEHRFTGGLNS